MVPTALLLIFLSACGVVHVEIRDKEKQVKTQSGSSKPTEQAFQRQTPAPQTPAVSQSSKPAEQTSQRQDPVFQAPVKGRANPAERGYRIITTCGELFRSVSDGKVLYVGDEIKGYGWVVMVDGDDPFVYVYGRVENPMVKRGERIRKGQVLGKVGRMQEGCGLLFEVRDKEGKPVSFQLML